MAWKFYLPLMGLGVAGMLFSSAQAQVFQIDPSASEVRVLVYREGALSNISHNHVIVSQELQGQIVYHAEAPETSSVQASLAVTSLIVDDPKHRQQEGGDFAQPLSESDIGKIREKMLSDAVLDAELYPEIKIESVRILGVLPKLEVQLKLQIHGQIQELPTLANVELQDKTLTAEGRVTLKQSDFGITPISLFLGTIRVKDELKLRFKIVAKAPSH